MGSLPPVKDFQATAGVQLNHVPYKASNEVMAALISGDIQLAFDNVTFALPQAKAGTVRALGMTGPNRSAAAPDIPTIAETLPGFDAQSWHGLFAPAGTPKAVVEQIAADVKRIFEQPAVTAKLKEIGAEPAPMSPDAFAAFGKEERGKYREIVAKAGIAPQ